MSALRRRSGHRRGVIALVALGFLLVATEESRATPDDALIPLQDYTSSKGKTLGETYQTQLVNLYENIYYCLPWLGIRKHTLGFPKQVGGDGDTRYLSVMIDVDLSDPNGEFAALPRERRVSAMFSRYGVDILRRMLTMTTTASDSNLAGFGVALTWPLQVGKSSQPKSEAIALFVDKSSLVDFLAKRLQPQEFMSRAKVSLWDGDVRTALVKLDVWDDDFNSTYKLKNYVLPPGYKCN